MKKIVSSIIVGITLTTASASADDFSLLADAVEYLIKQTKEQSIKIDSMEKKIAILQESNKELLKKSKNGCNCPEIKTMRADIARYKKNQTALQEKVGSNSKTIETIENKIKTGVPTQIINAPVSQKNSIDDSRIKNKLEEQKKRLQNYIESRKELNIPSVK